MQIFEMQIAFEEYASASERSLNDSHFRLAILYTQIFNYLQPFHQRCTYILRPGESDAAKCIARETLFGDSSAASRTRVKRRVSEQMGAHSRRYASTESRPVRNSDRRPLH